MRIYLIRHGQSEANEGGVIQGQLDTALTAKGRGQARRLGQFLQSRDIHPDRILTSPLARAHETALLLAGQLEPVPEVVPRDFLAEVHVGALQGMSLEEIRRSHENFYSRPIDQWLDYSPWGGESRAALYARVTAGLDAELAPIDPMDDRVIAIVAHGGTMRALFAYFLNQPDSNHLHYHLGNCTLVRLGYRGADQGVRPIVDLLLHMDMIDAMMGTEEQLGH